MPIYEYECLNCAEVHEALRKFSDKPLSKCPKCSGTLKKAYLKYIFLFSKAQAGIRRDYASKPSDSAEKPHAKKDSGAESKQKPRKKLNQRANRI